MKYEKEAFSLEAQADKLLARGLVADRDELVRRLRAVNYYRFSGYLHPYRIGYTLAVCHFWLGKISSTSLWRERLFALFDEYSEIPLGSMGLPENWREHPLFEGH